MAKRIKDKKNLIQYSHGNGGFTAYHLGGRIDISTFSYYPFHVTPSQARHIAKKLNQFADDIEGK